MISEREFTIIGDAQKLWVGIEGEGVPKKFSWGMKLACWWSLLKKEESYKGGMRGRRQSVNHSSSWLRASWTVWVCPCAFHRFE